MSIDFGVTNKSERVGKLTSTESRNNEDQLYMYIFVYLFHARHVQVWMISGWTADRNTDFIDLARILTGDADIKQLPK